MTGFHRFRSRYSHHAVACPREGDQYGSGLHDPAWWMIWLVGYSPVISLFAAAITVGVVVMIDNYPSNWRLAPATVVIIMDAGSAAQTSDQELWLALSRFLEITLGCVVALSVAWIYSRAIMTIRKRLRHWQTWADLKESAVIRRRNRPARRELPPRRAPMSRRNQSPFHSRRTCPWRAFQHGLRGQAFPEGQNAGPDFRQRAECT